MRHATMLVAILAFVPLASATAQEQLRDVRTTTFAAANSVLVFHPGQGGQGPLSSGWCRRWNPCLRGGVIGLLVGAGVGAVIGLASGDEPPDLGCALGLAVGLAWMFKTIMRQQQEILKLGQLLASGSSEHE